MTYAEAVTIFTALDRFYAENNSTGRHSEAPEALAVLRRAEGVMGAVEGAAILPLQLDLKVVRQNDSYAILRAVLAYKETP